MVTVVSVGPDGQAAGIGGYTSPMAPVISPDGRYVAFENNLGNILPGVSGDQIYLRDLSTGTTTAVSAPPSGSGSGNGISSQPIFSADSHNIVFLSTASNLVAGINTAGQYNVYERDLVTGVTTLVECLASVESPGNNLTGTSFSASVRVRGGGRRPGGRLPGG